MQDVVASAKRMGFFDGFHVRRIFDHTITWGSRAESAQMRQGFSSVNVRQIEQ